MTYPSRARSHKTHSRKKTRKPRRNPRVTLTQEEFKILKRLLIDPETPPRLATRARIVLLASDDISDRQIAFLLEIKEPLVKSILSKFDIGRIEGIAKEFFKPSAQKKVVKDVAGSFVVDNNSINLAAIRTVRIGDMLVFVYNNGKLRLFTVMDRYSERGRSGGVMLDLIDNISRELLILTDIPSDLAMIRKVHSQVEKSPLLSSREGNMILFVYDNGDLKLFYIASRSRDKEEVYLVNAVTGDNLTLFARHLPKRVVMARSVLTGINVRTLRKVRFLRTGETKATKRGKSK